MLTTFVLIVHTLLAAALVAVILLQRSEGGGLGIGSGAGGGLVSARGAADLLTRSTALLAAAFIGTSLLLAVLYGQEGKTRRVDASAVRAPDVATAPAIPTAPAPGAATLPGVPFALEPAAAPPAPGEAEPPPPSTEVPLAQ